MSKLALSMSITLRSSGPYLFSMRSLRPVGGSLSAQVPFRLEVTPLWPRILCVQIFKRQVMMIKVPADQSESIFCLISHTITREYHYAIKRFFVQDVEQLGVPEE